ncbi:MAG: S41 family peptidase [Planctomycetia bacterium]|nr:S41 family peptidase [Planctomycetia bacterium]
MITFFAALILGAMPAVEGRGATEETALQVARPKIETLSASIPTVMVPTLTVPTVTVPTISTPTRNVSATYSTLNVPVRSADTQDINTQNLSTRSVGTLNIDTQNLSTRSVGTPNIDTQRVNLQEGPKIEIPAEAEMEAEEDIQLKSWIQQVIRDGKRLEQECRWKNALMHYESAFRAVPTSEVLQSHYTRARVLCDIQKRYSMDSYIEAVGRMNGFQTRAFSEEFLRIFRSNYVHQMTYSDIFYREICCMEIALGNSTFCDRILPTWRKTEVEKFRQEMVKFSRSCVIQNQTDLQNAMVEISRRFKSKFNQNPSFLVLDGLLGFILTLDCYSEVLLNHQYQDLLTSVSGNMVGVGVEFRTENGITTISGLVPYSPAWKSDLQKKDIILGINDTPIQNWSLERVAEKMEGMQGEPIRLKVQTGNNPPRDVLLIREALTFSSIEHSMMIPDSENVGYVRLASFQFNSATDLHQALLRLKEQGMTKLVLDLRGNSGGTVPSAIAVSDLFLSGGVILQERNYERVRNHHATMNTPWENLPLVVLINEKSASAAEIFAGAIQERNRGILVGKRSYGKGTIQTILDIPGSNFVMRLTTANFFSPSGKRYNYVGIKPNHEVYEVGKPIFEEMEDSLERPSRAIREDGYSEKTGDPVLKIAMQTLEN